MIIITIKGGLGNQLSQYAFYKLLKTKYHNTTIKADISYYSLNNCHEGFELYRLFGKEKLGIVEANYWECAKTMKQFPPLPREKTKSVFSHIFKYLRKVNNLIIRKILKSCGKYRVYIQLPQSQYPEDSFYWNLNASENWYLDGYWMNYNYDVIMDELREKFSFPILDKKNILIAKDISNVEAVSIHIRRGDYLNSEYNVLDMDYYKKAVQHICKSVISPVFFIFSDDKNYIEENIDFIDGEKYYVISDNIGENSYIDMQLMSMCKHNILANSTFSYWAALLNSNLNKIVIWPKKYTINTDTWRVNGWERI